MLIESGYSVQMSAGIYSMFSFRPLSNGGLS